MIKRLHIKKKKKMITDENTIKKNQIFIQNFFIINAIVHQIKYQIRNKFKKKFV